jgi:catechol 2,3-dioxygenase-like lactoylglutathione lyase family enzyme
MALHGLGKVTIGVPNVDDTIAFYTDFGLEHRGGGVFATRNGPCRRDRIECRTSGTPRGPRTAAPGGRRRLPGLVDRSR